MFTGTTSLKYPTHKMSSCRFVAEMNAFKILTGKPTGNKPLGRSRRRLEDNIRMDLKEVGINLRNWVDSAQDWDY